MTIKTGLLAASIFLGLAVQAHADITITDPYARSSRPGAPTGAAFMVIENTGPSADRLIAAASDVAKRVELHTHIESGDGVMLMRHDEDGFEIPAKGEHGLKRGGDHVMFMGLTRDLTNGESVEVTLTFEKAGDIVVEIPVDNDRAPAGHGHGHDHGHGEHDHGSHDHN